MARAEINIIIFGNSIRVKSALNNELQIDEF